MGRGVREAEAMALATVKIPKEKQEGMVTLLVCVQFFLSLKPHLQWGCGIGTQPPSGGSRLLPLGNCDETRTASVKQDLPVLSAAVSAFSIAFLSNKDRKKGLVQKAVDQGVVGIVLHPSGSVPMAAM